MGRGKKAAAAAAVTAAAVAGMVTGTVFENPADLMQDPNPIVSTQQAADDDGDAAASEERQRAPATRVREWVLRLPAAVRMLVGVPLWALGWVLLTGLSTLWASALSPVVSRLLGWLCLAIILIAVFAASVKAAFPALPLRKILRPRNVVFLLTVTALLALADLALPTVWEGYDLITQTVWRVGATCLLAFSCCAALGRNRKRGEPRRTPEERTPEERTPEEIREIARQLADSVSPRRD